MGDDIHAEDTTTCSLKKLRCKLAKKSESDDRDRVAQLHIRGADSVQGNRPYRRKRGLLEGSLRAFCDFGHQQSGDACNLRVHGISCACAGHSIAHGDIADALTYPNDGAGTAVAQSSW